MKIPFALVLACGPVAALAIVPAGAGDLEDTFFTFVGRVGSGSAVAVAPNKILTAKHIGGTVFTLPGVTGGFNVVGRVEHPDADFAILTVAGTLPGFYEISTELNLGSTITMVGLGDTGTLRPSGLGYNPSPGTSGKRRAANASVDLREVIDLSNFNSPITGDNSPASASILSLLSGNPEGALNGGDSGGGWFVDQGGVFRLVGINSFTGTTGNGTTFTFSSDPNNGFYSGAVDLTQYAGFLQANGLTPVPEPASMILLTGGFAALALRRRRR